MSTTWTAREVRALGVRTDIETAGSIFGLSRTQAYEAVKKGVFPVDVIKIGRRYLVPTAPILRLLGLEPDDPAAAAPSEGPPLSPPHHG